MKVLNIIILFYYVLTSKAKNARLNLAIYFASFPLGVILLHSILYLINLISKELTNLALFGILTFSSFFFMDRTLNILYKNKENYIESIYNTYFKSVFLRLLLVLLGILLYIIAFVLFIVSFRLV